MAFEGTAVILVGNLGKDDPHKFKTNTGKKAVGFSLAVQPDFDAPAIWYDVATTNETLIEHILDKSNGFFGGAKGIVVQGIMQERQGSSKTFRNVWINRLGRAEFVDTKRKQTAEEEAW